MKPGFLNDDKKQTQIENENKHLQFFEETNHGKLDFKIDGKKESLSLFKISGFALPFPVLSDSTITPSMKLIHFDGEISGFKIVEQPDTVYVVILTKNKPKKLENKDIILEEIKNRFYFLKLDLSVFQFNFVGSAEVETNCAKFDFKVGVQIEDRMTFWVFTLSSEGLMSFSKIDFSGKCEFSDFHKKLNLICSKNSPELSNFTCFDFWPKENDSEKTHVSIGTKYGSIYHYIIYKGEFHLSEIFNEFANFNAFEVKILAVKSDKIWDKEKNNEDLTGLFFVIITSDGELKIFQETQKVSLMRIQFQNRPLKCLHIDPCSSLMYVLDETDQNLLTVVNFSKTIESNKGSDSVKRNIKLDHIINLVDFNFKTDSISVICDFNSLKTLPLRVC